MAGGSLVALVAYGSQNVILSGNPQMTYFYKSFKRYSHFAMENITIPLNGPNELDFDAPTQLRAKIPRYSDLMSELIFSFTIPDIYSKYLTPNATRTGQWEFQWVRYLGAAIIQNAAFFVGGQKIQEFDGSYLLSRALLDKDQDEFEKWKNLVGDNPELTNPSIGAYAGGSAHSGYPTVRVNPVSNPTAAFTGTIAGTTLTVSAISSGLITVGAYIYGSGVAANTRVATIISGSGGIGVYSLNNTQQLAQSQLWAIATPTSGAGLQLNRPSIFGRDIHVPLSFWFTESPSQSVPLVGLQYHECEVQLTLAPINQLYTILDPSGNRVNPEYRVVSPQANINQNTPNYVSYTDLSGHIRWFFTDFGATIEKDSWPSLNPRLQATFVSLPKEEQQIFATRPLSYLVNQVTQYPNPGLYIRSVLDLQTHNPLTRLIFVQRRSDAGQRNDFANFTNWSTYPYAPFSPTPGVVSFLQQTNTSGLLILNSQVEMIRGLRVLCDGTEIQEFKNIDYFTKYSPYKYTKGIGQEGLPIYSFQLGQNTMQPSGSLNASRIRNFQVEVDVYPLPLNTTYTYDVDIYVENINFFEVVAGMGGLKFAL